MSGVPVRIDINPARVSPGASVSVDMEGFEEGQVQMSYQGDDGRLDSPPSTASVTGSNDSVALKVKSSAAAGVIKVTVSSGSDSDTASFEVK